MSNRDVLRFNRRDLLRLGGAALIGGAARPAFAENRLSNACFKPSLSEILQDACAGNEALEVFPTSPFILSPFTDKLPVPPPLAPIPKSEVDLWLYPPDRLRQSSHGSSTHQIWPSASQEIDVYHLRLMVAQHTFTTSMVEPINSAGLSVLNPKTGMSGPQNLPPSTIFGYNGQFPGPMINAMYGKPVLVRFENNLDFNPNSFDVGDFGAPGRQFLTHLHNGHTAPESDGNPHFKPGGYETGEWVDNLYLNFPAGGDDREKQSFLWFHDHYEGFTGANVYKGLAGLYPLYDPILDPGDETRGGTALGLPGVRNAAGGVDYDIPLAFSDFRFDDGVTPHKDYHAACAYPAGNTDAWGTTFFRHFPDRGFVGDVFTVNGTAYPYLEVERRKYRFRLLDSSIARLYEFKLMTGHVTEARGTQGQYQLRDGEQCMQFTQIASEGGLLPYPVLRDSIKIWPAKRRELIIDFTHYQNGDPTRKDDEIYLVNVLNMPDGRKPESGSGYRAPIIKFVIRDDKAAEDHSVIPTRLRDLPDINPAGQPRSFELQRGGAGGSDPFVAETQWLVNDLPFQSCVSLASPRRGDPLGAGEIWKVKNGGGGWVHPMHIHQEEHQVLSRNGVPTPKLPISGAVAADIDDFGKEDTIPLGPGDSVVIFRRFRTFIGPYVAHCHNLAHEDHTMMFGWEISKP